MTTFFREFNSFSVALNNDAATVPDFSVDTTGATNITRPKWAVSTVAAAGSTQTDAAAVSPGINVVSAADGTKGVRLPVTTGGDLVIVKNTASAILKIYGATGAAINAGSANAAFSTTANPVPLLLFSTSATQWYTLPLVPT